MQVCCQCNISVVGQQRDVGCFPQTPASEPSARFQGDRLNIPLVQVNVSHDKIDSGTYIARCLNEDATMICPECRSYHPSSASRDAGERAARGGNVWPCNG